MLTKSLKEYGLRSQDLLKPKQKLIVWFWTGDKLATEGAETLLKEGRTYKISNKYSARFDRGISPHTQDHLHGFLKGNEIFALNQDGTGHHTPVGTRIPSDVADWIATDFPQFVIPPKRIITESEKWPRIEVSDAMVGFAYDTARIDLGMIFD